MEANKDNCINNGMLNAHIDNEVYQDILKTYAKETICLLPLGNLAKANIPTSVIKRVENTEYEISPFHKYDINCTEEKNSAFYREPSVSKFSNRHMDLKVLKQFLINSFASDETGRRPYPSGGAVYPVEPLIFIFEDRISNLGDNPFGCYHFRPVSKTLQLIKKIPAKWFYEELIHDYLDKNHLPSFVILYLAHIGKTIFKYRYRGYRHALIEVGTMCHVAGTMSQEMGLRNTVWSTFSEYQLLNELDLDAAVFMPVMMQLFGYPEE
jgi:SagB-type dehydrogenase family enzyme